MSESQMREGAAVSGHTPEPDDDSPFCRNCGYSLKGLTESSKCPECGKPIVEVLVRASFQGARRRYTSKAKLFGLPVLAIAYGPHGPERYGKPVGIIAIGDCPRGVVAIGGRAVGVIAIGGMACGVVANGGLAVGVVGLGGTSLGLLAIGGLAIGGWGLGGLVVSLFGGMGAYILKVW